MTERTYHFTQTDERIIERLVCDEAAMINHMVLPAGEEISEHRANSNVYLLIIRGGMRLSLTGRAREYGAGTVVNILPETQMHIVNRKREVLEFSWSRRPHRRFSPAGERGRVRIPPSRPLGKWGSGGAR